MRLVCEPGQEVLCDADAHVVTYEMGAAAAIFGISTRTVVSDGGRLDAQQLIDQVRPKGDWHLTATAAVAVENSHNRGGGLVQPLTELRTLWDWSRGAGVAVHLDGARIWNAAVASGTELSTYGRLADTASVCLSKGLGAPVGSVLAGPAAVVDEARAWRRRFGGQLRQAGVLAAAGLVGLDGVDRLADDHARVTRLASAVAERWPEAVDPDAVRTNLVVFPHPDPDAVLAHLAGEGVLAGTVAPRTLRLVTSLEVDDAGIDRACRALATAP